MPELIILVGGNGAGKSTYFELYLQSTGLPFVNADLIAKDLFGHRAEEFSTKAAKVAEDTRNRLVQSRQSFCFETVFSHPSKVDFLAQAKAAGYRIKMVAIYTDGPQLNCARVAQRVSAGGHTVPEDKIISRLPRTHMHIGLAIPLCDEFVLMDNSSAEFPYRLVLAKRGGNELFRAEDLPGFAADW